MSGLLARNTRNKLTVKYKSSGRTVIYATGSHIYLLAYYVRLLFEVF